MKGLTVVVALIGVLGLTACGTSTPTIALNSDSSVGTIEALRVYSIDKVMGIGTAYAAKLREAGLASTKTFLAATRTHKDREAVATKTGISETLILRWAHKVELMTISGIGPEVSQLLEAVGVDSTKELAQRNATNLQERMAIANNISNKKFMDRDPSLKEVTKWINAAKGMHITVVD